MGCCDVATPPEKRGEEKYRALLMNLPVGVAYQRLLVDEKGSPADFVYLDMNELFARLVGIDREEAIGRRATEVIPRFREAPIDWIALYGEVALDGQRIDTEFHSRHLDRTFQVTAYSTAPGYFTTIFTDVTERKLNELALRQQRARLEEAVEERDQRLSKARVALHLETHRHMDTEAELRLFRTLVDQSGDAIYVIEPDSGRILDANLQACAGLLLTREQLRSMHAWEFSATLPDEEAWRQHMEALRSAGRLLVRGRHRRSDGEEFPVEVSARLVRGTGRDYLVSVVRDISQRNEQVEELRTILRTAMDGYWLADNDGNLLDVNEAYCLMTGYSREELLRSTVAELDAVVTPNSLRRRLHEIAERGYDRFESRHRCKSGAQIDVEVAVTCSGLGRDRRYHVFLRDITLLKEMQRRLEEQVRELRRANEELEQFARGASHDLQQPLRTMKGFAGLLRRKLSSAVGEEIERYIVHIEEGADELQDYIDALLAAARLRVDSPPMERVDLAEVVDQVRRHLEGPIAERDARLIVSALPIVRGRRAHLLTVLLNLVDNAVKFGGTPPEIALSATREGDLWHVVVADNGPGISPGDQERIFQAFQRLHSTADKAGTGVGLALCRRIILDHGGRIWVESVVGEGASFHFTVPAMDPQGQ